MAPTESAAADLFEKRLVFVTGKGGVGKSTVSVALALAAARAGKRTILCEVAAQEHLSHVFQRREVGFHEAELTENLWAISIDPDESMREYVLLQLKVKAMRDLLFRSRIFNYLAAATPGLKELVTIGKIWELTLDQRKARGGRPLRPGRSSTRPRPGTGSASCRRPGPSPTSPGSGRSASRRRRSTGSSATASGPGSRWSRCPRRCR